jgi:hypothetical protein
MTFYVGLDIGKVNDPTALVVLEQVCPAVPESSTYRSHDLWRDGQPVPPPSPKPLPAHYQARHLERFPLGTSYPSMVAQVQTRMGSPVLRDAMLVVDATGVGRPVVDMFEDADLHPKPILIVGGTTVSCVDGYWHVPKRDLVSVLQVLMHAERLKFAEQLPGTLLLTEELLNFQVKITTAANDTYGAWREGQHDDLVLAVAMAAWFAEHGPKPRPPLPGTVSYVTY